MNKFEIGDRVMVFDPSLFKDDFKTPCSYTIRPATVLRSYIYKSVHGYEDAVVDVRFDHRPEDISRAHFITGIRKIKQ